MLSPRTWGCTVQRRGDLECHVVVPTHVGVYRDRSEVRYCNASCPHARGGVPVIARIPRDVRSLSPRTWGCTAPIPRGACSIGVVPTHVGVYRQPPHVRTVFRCCPHARGGAPCYDRSEVEQLHSSPRTWGCTGCAIHYYHAPQLIPTHVGVHRALVRRAVVVPTHPHARGGAPSRTSSWQEQSASSPRTWGCTGMGWAWHGVAHLIPTHVGVHRLNVTATRSVVCSSPRTWGCTD